MVSSPRADFIAERIQSLSNRVAINITVSHLSLLSGPSPAPNPPTAINPVMAVQVAGDTSVTITNQTASGRLVPGDMFTIQGIQGAFKVQANCIASMDVFTGVSILPAIPSTVAAGTPVTFIFVNQQTIQAYLSSSNKTQIEDGVITVIYRILVPKLNLTFIPQIGDRVTMNNSVYSIGNLTPVFAWGKTVSYELMVR